MKWGEVLDSSTKLPSPCYLNLRLTLDLQACSLSLPVRLFNKKPLCIDILLILICAPHHEAAASSCGALHLLQRRQCNADFYYVDCLFIERLDATLQLQMNKTLSCCYKCFLISLNII